MDVSQILGVYILILHRATPNMKVTLKAASYV
jgi:hypothetical protein